MALQPLWALASFQFPDLFIPIGRTPWTSDQLIARPVPIFWTGNGRLILLRGPLGAWGSLTCSKSTTIFPSLKIRRPPPVLNPRHSSHDVGTLPLDYGGHNFDLSAFFYYLSSLSSQLSWIFKTVIPHICTSTIYSICNYKIHYAYTHYDKYT
jgi:hypothetical protein